MVAIGRSAEAIDHLTVYPEAFGFAVIAVAILVLARFGRTQQLDATTSAIGYAEGAFLLGLTACTAVGGLDTANEVLAMTAGIILGASRRRGPLSPTTSRARPARAPWCLGSRTTSDAVMPLLVR
jgi:hypothetical protein